MLENVAVDTMLEDVTIGIPVFNEERFVAQAIESALKQDVSRVIISDNASTDGTEAICRDYAAQYGQITYVRHPVNMGSLANFAYCLDNAMTAYFMWLGGHDLLDSKYCRVLSRVLDANADAVMAYAPASYLDQEGRCVRKHYYQEIATKASSARADERVMSLICDISDYTLIQGMYRTEVLKRAMVHECVISPDSLLLARMAMLGRLMHVDTTTYLRRDLRSDDTLEDYMRRLSGEKAGPPDWSVTCNMLLNVVTNTPADGIIRRARLVRGCVGTLARYHGWSVRNRDMGSVLHYILRGCKQIPYCF